MRRPCSPDWVPAFAGMTGERLDSWHLCVLCALCANHYPAAGGSRPRPVFLLCRRLLNSRRLFAIVDLSRPLSAQRRSARRLCFFVLPARTILREGAESAAFLALLACWKKWTGCQLCQLARSPLSSPRLCVNSCGQSGFDKLSLSGVCGASQAPLTLSLSKGVAPPEASELPGPAGRHALVVRRMGEVARVAAVEQADHGRAAGERTAPEQFGVQFASLGGQRNQPVAVSRA